MAAIDPHQPLPIYVQLKTLLREEILRGSYGPGDQLPTEHQLCERYQISRTPVHRALAELAGEGVILRQRRRGTFVNPHWVNRHADRAELRVVVPEGPWEALVREACPEGVSLNVATVALDDLHQVVTHAVAEGRAPDVALLDSVWIAEFAASGFLMPLDDLDRQWLHGEYIPDANPAFVDANRHDGQTVAVQAEADVAGVWYHRPTLAAAGVEPPSTWADVVAAARTLAAQGVPHPFVMPTGSRAGETTTYCLLGLFAANGAKVLDDGAVVLDTPAVIDCLTFLRDLVRSDVLPVDSVSYEHDRAARLLARNQAAMCLGGSYEARTLAAESGIGLSGVWEEFGFVPPPSGPGGGTTLAGGMVHAVFRQATSPQLAMRLLRSLSEPAALADMSRRTWQLPVRRSAATLVSAESEFLRETAAMAEGAVARPVTRTYPRVSTQIQAMIEAVVVGRLEPAAAANRAAELVAAITGLPIGRAQAASV